MAFDHSLACRFQPRPCVVRAERQGITPLDRPCPLYVSAVQTRFCELYRNLAPYVWHLAELPSTSHAL